MLNKVFVGDKKFEVYCERAFLHLFDEKEVQLLARGKYIARAVSVVTRMQRIFPNARIRSVEIGQETFLDEQSHEKHISTIAITMGLVEGEGPLIKQTETDTNKVFVGQYKKLKSYCGRALLHLFASKEIQILAMGLQVSRAVNVTTRLQRIFPNVKIIKNVEISTERFLDEQSHERHKSTIAIPMGIVEGEYPLIKQDEVGLKIENGSCFICTKEDEDVLFSLPLFLFINEDLIDFRKFEIIRQNGKLLRRIPNKHFRPTSNKIKLCVFNNKEMVVFQGDVSKLPTPKIEDASRFIFEKKLKFSIEKQFIEILEKTKEWTIKVAIDGKPASTNIRSTQENSFEVEVLEDVSFNEKHKISIWIENKEVVSSDEVRIRIPAFEPKLGRQCIIGETYKITAPELLMVPVEVIASIPGVTDELSGENELDLSPYLIEYVRKTQGDVDEVQFKAKLVYKNYVGKEIVKNIKIMLPDTELNETYEVDTDFEIKIPRDFPLQEVKVVASLREVETEFCGINVLNLGLPLLEFVEKNYGSNDTVTIKSKFIYGKIGSTACEKEIKILLPSPQLEFPSISVLKRYGDRFTLVAQEDNLKVRVVGPDFLQKENVNVTVNEEPVEVIGLNGNFEINLYEILRFDTENILKCRFEYGKLTQEVISRLSRESVRLETTHKIIAFQKFSLKVLSDYSLVGERLYFLDKEIRIKKTNFEIEFLAAQPGEYQYKIFTSRADVPEKKILLKVFPYFYVEDQGIYNKAQEKLSLRLYTDRSMSEDDIRNVFSEIDIKGRQQNYKLTLETMELTKSQDGKTVWDADFDINNVFPSKYDLGPFSVEKNGVTSTAESRSIIIVDLHKMEVDRELIYGASIRQAVIMSKNSPSFFDEFYDEGFDESCLRMEVVRKSPFVHKFVTSNPKELHELNKCLQRAFSYGPGRYEVRFFVRNKSTFTEEVTVCGVFLREKVLFVGRSCRVHIFAESAVQVEFDRENIAVEKVAEYYHICNIIPKRKGEIELDVKVSGKTVFHRVCLVQVAKIKRVSVEQPLEEILDKSISDMFLVYDKNTSKFISDMEKMPDCFKRISKHFGLKGIILHPLFALNEVCKDVLFDIFYKLHKSGQQLRLGFISLPMVYGGPILSPKVAEKVDFIPLVQRKCDKCGKRAVALVKDANIMRVSCTSCETIDPEKIAFQVVNIPETFRCPECAKSWLLPCYSPHSSKSKISLICPICSTQIDHCYFTIEEFEKSLPDVLFLSDKMTEWLRYNYTYLLEQRALLCDSCGRTHPICSLFQIRDHEKTLEEVKYNWETIRQSVLGLIEEKKKLKRRIKILKQIGLLREIRESKDLGIIQWIKKASLDGALNLQILRDLLNEELLISNRYSALKTQLENIARSLLKKIIYLLKKGLGLDKREKELDILKQQLDEVKRKKENWFIQMKGIVENKIAESKKELGKLPRTRYGSLESIKHEMLTKIESLTTLEQRKLIGVLKKQGIISADYDLKENLLTNLMEKSKCPFCGGRVQSMPALSFFLIACYDSVLVSDDLLAFTIKKERFIDDFYLYEPFVKLEPF